MLMYYTQIVLLGPALTSTRCYFEDEILETEWDVPFIPFGTIYFPNHFGISEEVSREQ
jgi:hypothetical protein